MRRLFDNAKRNAPALLFFDEIDCITAKRDGAGKEMERRIVAQFLSCMDELGDMVGTSGGNVIVMGATNRPEALDASLRRAGRFDREINLGVPDEAGSLLVCTPLSSHKELVLCLQCLSNYVFRASSFESLLFLPFTPLISQLVCTF